MFQKEILEEANCFFFEEQQSVNGDELMDADTTSPRLQASNILGKVYAKSVIL